MEKFEYKTLFTDAKGVFGGKHIRMLHLAFCCEPDWRISSYDCLGEMVILA